MMKVLPTKSKVYEMMAQEQVHHEIGKQEHLDVQESSMAHRGKKEIYMKQSLRTQHTKNNHFIMIIARCKGKV